MNPGTYFLYAGAGLAGVTTLFCFLSGSLNFSRKTNMAVLITGWSLAAACIITGIVWTQISEKYCCNNSYTQIFAQPMNKVRDPDNTKLQNLKTLVGDQRRSTEYTRYQYPRFGRRSNYASQRYQYAY